jgi:hypothetical protein
MHVRSILDKKWGNINQALLPHMQQYTVIMGTPREGAKDTQEGSESNKEHEHLHLSNNIPHAQISSLSYFVDLRFQDTV